MVSLLVYPFLTVPFRSRRDAYETVTGRVSINSDTYPQWRHLVWSPDSTMVACSYSSGVLEVFDIVGTLLFTIPASVSTVVTPIPQWRHLVCIPDSTVVACFYSSGVLGVWYWETAVYNTCQCKYYCDPYPQWRHLVCIPDSTLVACFYNSWVMEVCDIVGSLLFTIPASVNTIMTLWHLLSVAAPDVESRQFYGGLLLQQLGRGGVWYRRDSAVYYTCQCKYYCDTSVTPTPQWRHLIWSPDSTMMACFYSSGVMAVFDIVGTAVYYTCHCKYYCGPSMTPTPSGVTWGGAQTLLWGPAPTAVGLWMCLIL